MPDIFVQPGIEDEGQLLDERAKEGISSLENAHEKVGIFSAISRHPDNFSYENQDNDEEVLLFLRRHFITNLPWIIITVLAFAAPFLVSVIARATGTDLSFIPQPYMVVFGAFYYILIFAYAYINFLSWSFNISLVTTKRIVDIDFSEIVYHNVAVTKLELIEDIDYSQVGFIRTFFNYGDVFMQTAGEKPHFDFLRVPKPALVVDITEELIGKRGHHA